MKPLGDGSVMYFTPIDTTKANTTRKSRPPSFQLYAYRVAETLTGNNIHQHRSGKFYYDQQCGIALTGKTQEEYYRKSLDRGSYSPSPKDNDYLPQQPDFNELAQGGILEDPIKVLKIRL